MVALCGLHVNYRFLFLQKLLFCIIRYVHVMILFVSSSKILVVPVLKHVDGCSLSHFARETIPRPVTRFVQGGPKNMSHNHIHFSG